jgi:hypothetical protein
MLMRFMYCKDAIFGAVHCLDNFAWSRPQRMPHCPAALLFWSQRHAIGWLPVQVD